MSHKIPTAALRARHAELIKFAANHPVFNLLDLADYWQCSYATASTRVFNMRRCGLEIPPIQPMPFGAVKRHKTIHGNRRLRKHNKRIKPASQRYNGIALDMCGNPHEPICPHCKAAGRTGWDGREIHLQRDGEYRWCEVCGYDAGYSEYINAAGRLPELPPEGEMWR